MDRGRRRHPAVAGNRVSPHRPGETRQARPRRPEGVARVGGAGVAGIVVNYSATRRLAGDRLTEPGHLPRTSLGSMR